MSEPISPKKWSIPLMFNHEVCFEMLSYGTKSHLGCSQLK